MSDIERLTRDNFPLSRPSTQADGPTTGRSGLPSAINCTELADRVAGFVREGLSSNTRLAYASDLSAFFAWGGTLPATPEVIAAYLAAHADSLAISTLRRRLAAVSKAHNARQLPNPVATELVKATMRGIRRSKVNQSSAAKPLLRDDLFAVLDGMDTSASDTRDRALLLIGFAGGFRRSELVGLDIGDLTWVRQGIVVRLRRSKNDQNGVGRQIGIPHGRMRHCPVRSLECWLAVSAIKSGPLFRPVDRNGSVLSKRISGEAVSLVVKKRVAAVDLDPTGFSGHSLRAGFATSAAIAGVSSWKIRAQTGHACDMSVARYIRHGDLFKQNAASFLL
jgi:integrase